MLSPKDVLEMLKRQVRMVRGEEVISLGVPLKAAEENELDFIL